MRTLITLIFLGLALITNSQICLGTDTTVCQGQSVSISDCNNIGTGAGSGSTSGLAYDGTFIPYNADPLNEGTQITYFNGTNQVNLSDDRHSDSIDIGFDFCFWGHTYNKLVVSSNNYITFHKSYANLGSPWQLQQSNVPLPIPLVAYPYNNQPKNAILGPWQDIYPTSASNSIKYKVWGTAPYRRLSISWFEIPMFSCTSQLYSSQIIIYETTNVIETHILDKPVCGTWNDGLATHGLINSDGTQAIAVTGRNATQWTTQNEGYRFTPNDVVVWASTNGQTFPYNNGVLNVVATTDTVGYFLKNLSACSVGSSLSDTSWISAITPLISMTPVSCVGLSNGTATAQMVPPIGTITYQWNDPSNQTTQTATNLPSGLWNCLIQSSVGCSELLTINVTQLPSMVTNLTFNNPNCATINNGTAHIIVTNGTTPYSYVWQNSTSTLSTANDLPAGVNSVTVTDALGCNITQTFTLIDPPLVSIQSTSPEITVCSGVDTSLFIVPSGGNSPYVYSWLLNGVEVGTDSILNVQSTITENWTLVLSEECGSPSVDTTLTILVPIPPQMVINPDFQEQCTPSHFELFNLSNSSDVDTTIWSFSNGVINTEIGLDSTSIDIETPGNYSVSIHIISDLGCNYFYNFPNILKVDETPEADFSLSSNPTTFFETVVEVQNQSSSNVVNWEWFSQFSSPSNCNSENCELTFPQGEVGNYPITLTVFTEAGCFDTITKILIVNADIAFYAPNVFTPNGDERNQTWNIIVNGVDMQEFNLQIFDRWGEMVWETNDASVSWDGTYNGKMVTDGVYFWTAVAGDKKNDDKHKFSGLISVVR